MRAPLLPRMAATLLSATTAALLAAACTVPPARAAGPGRDRTPDSARGAAPAFDAAPARAALQRLLPARSGQFTLVPAARTAAGADAFTVSGRAGAIRVRGTSPATLLAGVGWYLRNVAHADIGLPGGSTSRLPATLPAVPAPHTGRAAVPHRYALNDTQDGYAGAYRSFADYRHEIDVLALHGYNEVLVTVGAELPYYRVLQEFGYPAAEARAWIPAPSHQAWWLLQNLSGIGGPAGEHLIEARAALGRRVCDLLRALGMTPVLPGYYGTVPTDFAHRNPGADVVAQGTWAGFTRDSWLDPADPLFPRVAAAYYAAQAEAFGDTTLYKMDPLHEGGTAGHVDVPRAAAAIQHALLAAHPDAVWVILGWENNPTTTLLSGVDKTRMLVVDGLSDRYDGLDRETGWGGTPYAFGTIPNFGGKTTLGANTGVWTARFPTWLAKPGSMLRGIAYMPEADGHDPAALALFGDLAWAPARIDRGTWFRDYATARYGGADPHAAAAWDLLGRGPYGMPAGRWSEPQDGLFSARPSLTASTTGTWSPPAMRYDASTVRAALAELLAVDPQLRGTDAYRYDLVDVARQALANRSRELLPQIRSAYRARDLAAFRALVAQWQTDEAALDRLLATDPHFMVGNWLAQTGAWADTPAERAQYAHDARSILTTWGDTRAQADTAKLCDYAGREWSGLVSDLYARRWAAYFASLDRALTTGGEPAPVDFFAMDDAWARDTAPYPTAPAGDAYTAAAAVAALLDPGSAPASGARDAY